MNRNPLTKRAYWHNYCAPGRYLITLSKSPDIPPFSSIEGDLKLPIGSRGSSYTRWSPIGKSIADQIYHISNIHPALKAEQYTVMPDHVHILLRVQTMLPEPLGLYIARLKNSINIAAETSHVFENGFNDQIITPQRNLQTIFNYIRSNPFRLAVRRANRDFFTRYDNILLGGCACRAYGNFHLLDNPFKDQVIIHRADTPDVQTLQREKWLYTAANGGVLVSPFISQAEKAIRTEAEALGARIILITHEAFPERFKPAARDFNLCCEGRLLIISLGLPSKTALSRQLCLRMNTLAECVASSTAPALLPEQKLLNI